MFFSYLRRELVNRRRQTVIIAVGLALAIALVIVVNSVSAGVRNAQASVLQSVYGVGTDITVSQEAAAPADGELPGRFEFGANDGSTTDGSTTVSQSRLMTGFTTATFADSVLTTVVGVDNVKDAVGVLALTNTTFNGEMPDPSQMPPGGPNAGATTGGADGSGGSAFDVDSFTVLGLDPASPALGPLSAVTLSDGRSFASDDVGANVAVLDSDYATSAELAVGDSIAVAGEDFEVIGVVQSTSTDASSASNVYIPIDVAQSLSENAGLLSSIYVTANSSTDIAQIKADLEAALPENKVSTQADLASSVSGSLGTASNLVASLGTWLSVIVLGAAFLIAILFTISGVSRRTREFGTLKAIGWSNSRIVRQVAGESVVQGLIGGAVGIALGVLGTIIVNSLSVTLSSSTSPALPGGPGGGFAGPPGAIAQGTTTDIVLNAPLSAEVVAIAVGLSILGGLLAGAFGGWRAARLRPAEALRSVA